jgi:hypothetical protein
MGADVRLTSQTYSSYSTVCGLTVHWLCVLRARTPLILV